VLGHTVVSVPFVVVTIMAVLKNYDERLDQAAWSLGANKLKTLRYITLPLILPGLLSAYLFAFVISLDELTIALFVSGGQAPTLPKQMWVDAIFKVNPMVTAVSTVVLVFVTSLILLAEFARRRSEKASGH
jgi:putative spermidine/putrescine transport system permease protein